MREKPFVYSEPEIILMSVMSIGRRFIDTLPMLISASGCARFLSMRKDAPSRSPRFERKWYAAMKNGTCSSENEPRRAYTGL